jgi:hypothetical protein
MEVGMMSQFEFIRWEAQILSKGELIGKRSNNETAEIQAWLNRDYKQMAEYYLQHAVDGLQAEPNNYRWDILKSTANKVLQAESVNDIAIYCISMGGAIKAFDAPTSDETSEYFELKIQRHKREGPLQLKNSQNADMKKIIQALARSFWERDCNNEIKLSDMAEKVWAYVADLGHIEKLPFDKSEGLKNWLRPVSMEFGYPSAKGRPKKE